MIVCRQNNGPGWNLANGASHAPAYCNRVFQCQRGNARSTATQKGSQRAGSFRRRDNRVQIGNQFGSKRLMKCVGKVSTHRPVISTNECGGDSTGIPATANRTRSINPVRQNLASSTRFYFVIWNQHYALEPRRHFETLHQGRARYRESAITCRRGIIRMTLQLSAQLKEYIATNRITGEPIQAAHQAEPNRCAAAQSAGTWQTFPDPAGEGKWAEPSLLEENVRGRVQHLRHRLWPRCSLNRNPVIQAQRHSQAIEPWSKIGDTRGDANGNC